MNLGKTSGSIRRIFALGVAVSILGTSVAFAEPASTLTPVTRTPATTGSAVPVTVDPNTAEFRAKLAEKQARLDELNAQLAALDKELEIAQEQHNAAQEQLSQTKQTVETAQADVEKARTAYSLQASIVGDRATDLYKEGELSAVEILLDASSVADLISRIKFLNTIGIRDAEIAESLNGQKQLVEKRLTELQGAQAAAESLEFEIEARKIEVTLRIQERQQLLSGAQSDLLELLEKEAARRKTEESALLAEILAGANEKGIVVSPGSPVETALAYHGIPYLWGGETPAAFDCSGLVLYVFRQHGVNLPHYSGSQFRLGEKVAAGALQPGDAVFFGSPIHHVGIYIGGGYYIHAPRTGDFVKISRLADRNDFAGARRYAWKVRVGEPAGAVKSTAQALEAVPNR